jgi:hypothetical protein
VRFLVIADSKLSVEAVVVAWEVLGARGDAHQDVT